MVEQQFAKFIACRPVCPATFGIYSYLVPRNNRIKAFIGVTADLLSNSRTLASRKKIDDGDTIVICLTPTNLKGFIISVPRLDHLRSLRPFWSPFNSMEQSDQHRKDPISYEGTESRPHDRATSCKLHRRIKNAFRKKVVDGFVREALPE